MNSYSEIDIFSFLRMFRKQDIIYIPNPGNAGDALIFYGTITVFNKLNLKYTIGDINTKYNNKLLFYGGGGNLVGLYKNCYNFIKNNYKDNRIVILPHTIKNVDEVLESMSDNIIFICREKISYEYVRSFKKTHVYLSKDMAFYINNDEFDSYKDVISDGECNAFRTDHEQNSMILPSDNNDLSISFARFSQVTDITVCRDVIMKLFNHLSKFRVINTNRLHIAIAGSLLNKQVNFYQNCYYKNKAVYDYSIKLQFSKTKLLD